MTADPVKSTIPASERQLDPMSKEPVAGNALGWFASLRARLGLPGGPSLRETIEDALKSDDKSPDAFSTEERSMLLRLLRFGALRVEDVMVPRADIIAADESDSMGDILRVFQDAGVSRIPLFNETLDDPRGMIHVKDLLQWMTGDAGKTPDGTDRPLPDLVKIDLTKSVLITKIRRQVLYVPPSMPAMNLLIRTFIERTEHATQTRLAGATALTGL